MQLLNKFYDMDENAKCEILSSEYLIRRPWLTARRDCIKLPDGVVNDEYYVLEYPDWVNVIAVTDRGEMVMVRQYRHGLQRTDFELCAGVVEDGEAPIDAARRELLEETGYAGGVWTEAMVLSPNPSTSTNLCHCFVAERVSHVADQHLDRTESITVHLFSRDEVYGMLCRNEIIQALMAAPLWRWFMKEKHGL